VDAISVTLQPVLCIHLLHFFTHEQTYTDVIGQSLPKQTNIPPCYTGSGLGGGV